MQAMSTPKSAPQHPRPWRTPSFISAGTFVNDVCKLATPAEVQAITKHSTVHKSFSMYYNQYVAIKIIDKSSIPATLADKFLPRELDVTRMVNHPNIARCLSVVQPHPTKVVIISEFCEGGTLLNYVMQYGGLPEFEAARLFHQLVEAIHYLHTTLSVAHRDVKLENMLLDGHRNLKLVDFGFARQATPATKSSSFCGTRPYSSPQLVDHIAYSPFAADWFACGITLYTMITGSWPHGPTQKITFPISYPFGKVSISARELIEALVVKDEKSRLDYKGIMESAWFMETLANSLQSLATTVSPYGINDENIDPVAAYHHHGGQKPAYARLENHNQSYTRHESQNPTYTYATQMTTMATAMEKSGPVYSEWCY
uniref:Protein kinase domain-containing protein n=1 Tax=Panagrellus redivivus TaxID=6233 RepID=A0A7E4USF0_PANRE